MLLGGFRAPQPSPQPTADARATMPLVEEPIEKEEYPTLLRHAASTARPQQSASLCARSAWRAKPQRHQVSPDCSSTFPHLPQAGPKPSLKVAPPTRAFVRVQTLRNAR